MKSMIEIIKMDDDLGFLLPDELVRKFDLKDGDFIDVDLEAFEKALVRGPEATSPKP